MTFFHNIKRSAFTLIELMVVMAIIVVLIVVAVPSIKAITKGNGVVQANNVIRAYLANARAIAISQHRQAGVVFFEETPANSSPFTRNQTAMQLIIEYADQSTAASGETSFVYYSKERQYLAQGLAVATLSDDSSNYFRLSSNSTAGNTARIILFDENGQMILHNGLVYANVGTGTSAGTYPVTYKDWGIFVANSGTPIASSAASSPGVVVFDYTAFKTEGLDTLTGAAGDTARTNWLKKNSSVLIVNAYTGGLIQ